MIDAFFRADAARLGMTVAEYERAFGVRLDGGPAESRTRYHEGVSGGLMDEAGIASALAYERRHVRAHRRRSARVTGMKKPRASWRRRGSGSSG